MYNTDGLAVLIRTPAHLLLCGVAQANQITDFPIVLQNDTMLRTNNCRTSARSLQILTSPDPTPKGSIHPPSRHTVHNKDTCLSIHTIHNYNVQCICMSIVTFKAGIDKVRIILYTCTYSLTSFPTEPRKLQSDSSAFFTSSCSEMAHTHSATLDSQGTAATVFNTSCRDSIY